MIACYNRGMKVFVYAFHKSASMFLYRYFKEMALMSGGTYFSVNNSPQDQSGWEEYRKGSFIVCPIRFKEGELLSMDNDAKNVIHLRDPIDVLISQYFSFGWTHTPSKKIIFESKRDMIKQKSIDEYCLEECGELSLKYRTLINLYDKIPNKIVSDYSSMRDDFKKWNSHMCRSVLGTEGGEIEKSLLKKFKSEFGFFHRLMSRRILPKQIISGNKKPHRRDGSDNQKVRYLKKETIEKLENEMKDVLEFFNRFRTEYEKA